MDQGLCALIIYPYSLKTACSLSALYVIIKDFFVPLASLPRLWLPEIHVSCVCHYRSGEQCSSSSRTCPFPVQSHDRSRCPPQRLQPQWAVLWGSRAREACSQTQSPVRQTCLKQIKKWPNHVWLTEGRGQVWKFKTQLQEGHACSTSDVLSTSWS